MFTFIYGPIWVYMHHMGVRCPDLRFLKLITSKLWAASISNLILIHPTTHQMFSTMSSFPVLCYFSLYCWKGYLSLQGFLNYFFLLHFVLLYFIFDTQSLPDLAVLKLAVLRIFGWSWMPRFTCLCLPSTRIKSMSHYTPASFKITMEAKGEGCKGARSGGRTCQ